MKNILFVLCALGCLELVQADDTLSSLDVAKGSVSLQAPDLDRGLPVMQALAKRKSVKIFSDKAPGMKDLSDLLWAANGVNRKDSGKRTAPSAMNRQDVKVYVCTKQASYLYKHEDHSLSLISKGDVRPVKEAPVVLLLVTDTGDTWAALDAGIVSQNISLFCSGTGLATYPRASMDKEGLKKALKLDGSQTLMLCHPVGYGK